MDIRNTYWNDMVQLKAQVLYLDLLTQKANKFNEVMNISMLLASIVCITGWSGLLIVRYYSTRETISFETIMGIWTILVHIGIIGYTILNFPHRLRCLCALQNDYDILYHEAEQKWFDIANGKLAANEVIESTHRIRERKTTSLVKRLQETTLPHRPKEHYIAQQMAHGYFERHFS